jgi:hypothetical protein
LHDLRLAKIRLCLISASLGSHLCLFGYAFRLHGVVALIARLRAGFNRRPPLQAREHRDTSKHRSRRNRPSGNDATPTFSLIDARLDVGAFFF